MKTKPFIVSMLLIFTQFCMVESKAQNSPALNDAKNAIAKSNLLYFQAFVKGDSSVFIDRYADDCCIMPPSAESLCGAKAAGYFFSMAYHQMGIRDGRFQTKELFGDGIEFVTESGVFELFDKNNNLIDRGKYLVLWRKTAKGWKMFRDCFSSNLPNK